MIIVGCDYHPGFLQIAFMDTDMENCKSGDWSIARQREKFCRDLGAPSDIPVEAGACLGVVFRAMGSGRCRSPAHVICAGVSKGPEKCRAIRVSETSLLSPVSAHRSTQAGGAAEDARITAPDRPTCYRRAPSCMRIAGIRIHAKLPSPLFQS